MVEGVGDVHPLRILGQNYPCDAKHCLALREPGCSLPCRQEGYDTMVAEYHDGKCPAHL